MSTNPNKNTDLLHQYARTVGGLQGKLDRVLSNQQAVADSLSRAAAALRSISSARRQYKAD